MDKPAGVTSHDVVAGIRRSLPKGTKVGHAGTLDPFATGLLIVLVGRATRTQQIFMGQPKVYEVDVRFGATSSTGDSEGEIVETGVVPPEDITLATGEVVQVPPRYSAIHVDGRRAHELARAGVEFELPERTVQVSEFVQTGGSGERRSYRIACSSGTYVRSLVSDLGDAYCMQLRRLSIGPFEVPHGGEATLHLHTALAMVLPGCEVNPATARDLLHGKSVTLEGTDMGRRFASSGGRPVAVVDVDVDGVAKTAIGFVDDYSAG